MFPLEKGFVWRVVELQSLEPNLEASLEHLAVGARSQARAVRKVKVHECHVGDSKSASVGCLDPARLGVAMVMRGVSHNERILQEEIKAMKNIFVSLQNDKHVH